MNHFSLLPVVSLCASLLVLGGGLLQLALGICSYVLFGMHANYFFLILSFSPSGRAQLLWPSVQRQTENRGMEGERWWWWGRKGIETKVGEMFAGKGASLENERRPFLTCEI